MSENSGRMPSISIRYAIPGVLALLIILAMALTGYLSYRSGLTSVEDLATRLAKETTTRIEEHIVSFLAVPTLFHQMNLAALKAGDVSLYDFNQMRELYWNQAFISPSVPYLYYGTEEGYFLGIDTSFVGEPVYKIRDAESAPDRVTYSLTPDGIPLEEIKRSEYDPRSRPWYQAAVEKGSLNWPEIYVSSAFPVLVISPVAPVYDNMSGQLIGVLGIDLTLGELSDFLRSLEVSPNGEAFIIERTGDMVATSSEDPPFKTEGEEQARLPAIESGNQVVRLTSEQMLAEFGSFENISDSRLVTFQRDNALYYALVSPVRSEGGLDWLSVVVIPANDFMGPVLTNLRNTALLGVLVLIFASVLGFLLASYIIRPVFTVTDVAASIEKENWQLEPLDGVSNRSDEIGQLARIFKRMAEEVHAREMQLKQQIRELTIQIDEAKKETQVREIVESDFFQDLQTRADQLRKARRKSGEP